MASIPDSKARPRSRKIPTPKQAFAGPPGSSQSSAAGMVIHPPSHPAQSPSRTVFSASMLLLMVGASEMCACPSAEAGTHNLQDFDYRWPCHIALRRLMGPRLRGDDSGESLLHIFFRGDERGNCYFIVGITNSAPSLMPEGQRAVSVLVLV